MLVWHLFQLTEINKDKTGVSETICRRDRGGRGSTRVALQTRSTFGGFGGSPGPANVAYTVAATMAASTFVKILPAMVSVAAVVPAVMMYAA